MIDFDDSDLNITILDNASPAEFYRCWCRITHMPTGVTVTSDASKSKWWAEREARKFLTQALEERG